MRDNIIKFLIGKGALASGKSNWIISWKNGDKLDIVDLIKEFTESQFNKDHTTDLDYNINLTIKFKTGETEDLEIITSNINKWVSHYQRNREPFTYEIHSKELTT